MKIAICAVPAILAAVLATGLFSANNQNRSTAGHSAGSSRSGTLNPGLPGAREDAGNPEDVAGQSEDSGDAPRSIAVREPEIALGPSVTLIAANTPGQRGAEPAAENGLTDEQAAPPAPEPGPTVAEPPHEAAGGWQAIRQRRPDVERAASPSQQQVAIDQLAREQEARREELRQQQAQDLEQFLQLQRSQYEELLAQQERDMAQAEQGLWPPQAQGDQFAEQRDSLAPVQEYPESSTYDNRPQLDPYPDNGPYQGQYREPNRRGTVDIPLPGRTWRFRLW